MKFNRFDLITVLLCVAVVGLLMMVALTLPTEKSRAATCVNNLKMICLSFRIFSPDSSGRYTHDIPENEGGAKEAVERGELFRIFQVMSNELADPKTVVCPSDVRNQASSFSSLSNSNVSYFVGVEANETRPNMPLSGDRNLKIQDKVLSGMVALRTNADIHWGDSLHSQIGHAGLADGSVRQYTNEELLQLLNRSGDTNNLVLFPQ